MLEALKQAKVNKRAMSKKQREVNNEIHMNHIDSGGQQVPREQDEDDMLRIVCPEMLLAQSY